MQAIAQFGTTQTGSFNLTTEQQVLTLAAAASSFTCTIKLTITGLNGYFNSWRFWTIIGGFREEYAAETEDATSVVVLLENVVVTTGDTIGASVLSSNLADTNCSVSAQVFVDATVAAINADSTQTAARSATLETNEIAKADQRFLLDDGVYKLVVRQRGTNDELIPRKTIKQLSGVAMTNPATQILGGFEED